MLCCLKSTAWCSTVLHCRQLHCRELHCTVQHRTVQHCTVQHCTVKHCNVQPNTVQHYAALYNTALHCSAPHCTALYSTALYRQCAAPLQIEELMTCPDTQAPPSTAFPFPIEPLPCFWHGTLLPIIHSNISIVNCVAIFFTLKKHQSSHILIFVLALVLQILLYLLEYFYQQ